MKLDEPDVRICAGLVQTCISDQWPFFQQLTFLLPSSLVKKKS